MRRVALQRNPTIMLQYYRITAPVSDAPYRFGISSLGGAELRTILAAWPTSHR